MTEQSGGAEEGDWFAEGAATFGDRLTAAREAAGMDQRTFARRLGVRLKTLESWENDLSEPRANRLQTVAGLLNVSIRWLLTGEGEGLSEPATDVEMAANARDLLADLRQVRTDMGRQAEKLGILEKRLRALMKDAL